MILIEIIKVYLIEKIYRLVVENIWVNNLIFENLIYFLIFKSYKIYKLVIKKYTN